MANVFIDTWAWIALLNKSDLRSYEALAVMQKLNRDKTMLVTSDFVLLEVADALSSPSIRSQTVGFIESLRKNQTVEIVPFSSELRDRAWLLYAARPDKEWGLTDCTSFIIMQQKHIHQVFTADHHFVQAGFQNLVP